MTVPVETITTSGEVSRDVEELVRRLGGITRFVQRGERVLIKPACNSPYAFPATTDLGVIAAMVELVRTVTDSVAVGDSSGFIHKPTRVAFDGTGLTELATRMSFSLIDFDAHDWQTHADSRAARLTEVRLTARLADFDRLIFLPTMRTHAWARITMALKVGMGLAPVPDRKRMHRTALEEMLGELNLYFKPDLVILDGRKCFINGGPDSGDERAPGVLLASTGRVAIDTEAVRILKRLGAYGLDMPAEDVPMIRVARDLGID
ncbi:MAG: DUF362 domain-containing protein [Dehalococcoidia bacterium]|jgi:uncharacterized protein (DUF362 family)|nr:DUF362 domain-containing protein [Dehalococcoidia bacterium]